MNFDHILPFLFALVVALPFLVLIRQFVYTYIRLKDKELMLLSVKSNSDVKIQAYERMTMFLERIKPSNLVTKFDKELGIHEFIFLTEKSINDEFEYNSSQQLYISKTTWENIISCKNNLIQNLHKTYENINGNAVLQDYKTVFLMNYVNGEDYITETIQDLRKEVNLLI